MIAELIYYHTEDGRHYERPASRGAITAIERIRLDVVELHYTKVKGCDRNELLTEARNFIYTAADGSLITGPPIRFPGNKELDQYQWLEAIALCHRCVGDTKYNGIIAVGHTLIVYGDRDSQVRLEAYLGPLKQEKGEKDDD